MQAKFFYATTRTDLARFILATSVSFKLYRLAMFEYALGHEKHLKMST